MNTHNLNSNRPGDTQSRESAAPAKNYQELPGLRHETKDVLKQLDSNILLLEDLSGRVSFMLAEIRSLVR